MPVSSRLSGLKFMQRAEEKKRLAAQAEVAQEAEKPAVALASATRCVVIFEDDPPPASAGVGRFSFKVKAEADGTAEKAVKVEEKIELDRSAARGGQDVAVVLREKKRQRR